VIGGRRLDKTLLATLDLPAGMRALLYQNRGDHFSPELLVDPSAASKENVEASEKLQPLIDAVRHSEQETTRLVKWSADEAEDEVFHAIPLLGTGEDRPLLAVLL